MSQNNDTPAFKQLQAFIAKETAPKPRRKGSKPETSNSLTRRIVEHVRKNGGFASRLASTGQYRDDLKKWISSQQVSGLPDILAVFAGWPIFVEVKVGRDSLSDQQEKRIAELEKAGARVFIAHDFDSFRDWFSSSFLTPPF